MGQKTCSDNISSFWRKYKKTRSVEIRNKLVKRYVKTVRIIAWKLKKTLPKNIEIDDLMSSGVLGLIQAVDKFDPFCGVKFETYCETRIRGAMIDELRVMDWVKRIVRLRKNKYREIMKQRRSGNGNGCAPTKQEIAEYFDVSVEEAGRIERDGKPPVVSICSNASLLYHEYEFDHPGIVDPKSLEPWEEIFKSKNEGFFKLISPLSDREKIVVIFYYKYGVEWLEIGKILRLSEKSIFNIRHKALKKIREFLAQRDSVNYL